MGNKSYVDKNNNVFIRISQKKLAKLLKTSEPTLRKSLHRLEDVELLEINVVGKNECNIMYVGNPVRTITFGEYAESIGKSLEEEKEEFVPSINVDKVEDFTRNKKASSTAIDEAPQSSTSINNLSNNSIPQKDKKDAKKIKKDSEILQVIKDSCVSIREEHLKECEELFTDIDRLKLALEICENNNSNGIKALKLAYKKAYTQNNNSNDNFTNNFSKGAGSGVNNNFAKYGNDLEAILQKSQEGKFKDMEQGISQFNPNFKL
jgi:DNA-binding Lrp family transcriptional regulator